MMTEPLTQPHWKNERRFWNSTFSDLQRLWNVMESLHDKKTTWLTLRSINHKLYYFLKIMTKFAMVTAWNVSKYGVFLVCIIQYLDWIRKKNTFHTVGDVWNMWKGKCRVCIDSVCFWFKSRVQKIENLPHLSELRCALTTTILDRVVNDYPFHLNIL